MDGQHNSLRKISKCNQKDHLIVFAALNANHENVWMI